MGFENWGSDEANLLSLSLSSLLIVFVATSATIIAITPIDANPLFTPSLYCDLRNPSLALDNSTYFDLYREPCQEL
ncbi:hypothetical protein ACFX12_018675 [Malus domestica]